MTKGGEILPNLVTLGHLHRTSTKCSAQPYLYPWWSVQSSVTRFGENLFLWEKFTIFVINFEDLINVFQKNIVSTIFCPYATFNCCKCSCIKQAIFTFGHTGLLRDFFVMVVYHHKKNLKHISSTHVPTLKWHWWPWHKTSVRQWLWLKAFASDSRAPLLRIQSLANFNTEHFLTRNNS